ncbi:hypothetical protein [Humibacter ginsenosidimutans]|uniref:Uncharacterized protein n=1 Tax=Humibacter ginsenosidimutans TaxID=2599293 RepID=A0A5B8M8D4_9MICO|nr:hypothetical protein [Humibacter ginsenosidimutans]QDZ16294.1 hypothetical protein FPZ11_17410 [Humibacter ginsenosidimutans]
MTDMWWLTPLLALLGALLGAFVSPWISGIVGERRAERTLVRDARIALERWNATRTGPSNVQYPGMDATLLAEVSNDAHRKFFTEHFAASLNARAALGAVRQLDDRIAKVVDVEDWRIPVESLIDLREGLAKAEMRAMAGLRSRGTALGSQSSAKRSDE